MSCEITMHSCQSDILVSIIIPTFNREDIVGRAIDSALAQTYERKEIIVVDDGSTDGTLDLLKKYEPAGVRIIAQQNRGPSAARNRGVCESRGQLLAFLDSDDVWLPEKLERQVRLLERAGRDVPCCLCNAIVRSPGRDIPSFDLAPLEISCPEGVWTNATEVLSTRGVVFTQAVIARRDVFSRIGGFDEDLRLMEDWDLSLRLSQEGPLAFIAEPLVIYHRDREDNLSNCAGKGEPTLYRSIIRASTKALSSGRRLPGCTNRELRRQVRNAQIRLRLCQSNGGWGLATAGDRLRIKFETLRLILFRRFYKFVPGLLPRVRDYPIG